jgi:ABC-type lipoprotein export system ATPase subunit
MKIELQNLSRHYQTPGTTGRLEVLKNITLSVQPGDALAIVGPSGSGKSTLLNILGTLDLPDSGTVKINGKNPSGMSEKELAAFRNTKLGFVFQLHYLLPQLTLLENVLVPVIVQTRQARQKAVGLAMELLDSVGLADRVKQKPGQMSVGECQRGALVRALINHPELILADEPTGSLDAESADMLGDLLVKINIERNISLVVVTHSEKLAARMKKVYHLTGGQLTQIQR